MRIFQLKKNHLGKKLWFFLTQKLLKVTIFQKLKITQKILFMQKMSAKSIPIYPANVADSEFLGRRLGTCGVQTQYEILRHNFFWLIAHLLCQDGQF